MQNAQVSAEILTAFLSFAAKNIALRVHEYLMNEHFFGGRWLFSRVSMAVEGVEHNDYVYVNIRAKYWPLD